MVVYTFNTFAFAAIAELLDNAVDEVESNFILMSYFILFLIKKN